MLFSASRSWWESGNKDCSQWTCEKPGELTVAGAGRFPLQDQDIELTAPYLLRETGSCLIWVVTRNKPFVPIQGLKGFFIFQKRRRI